MARIVAPTDPARDPPRQDPSRLSRTGASPQDESSRRDAVNRDAAVNESARREDIATAAYHLAARRGFAPGSELADWLQAEQEWDRQFRAG